MEMAAALDIKERPQRCENDDDVCLVALQHHPEAALNDSTAAKEMPAAAEEAAVTSRAVPTSPSRLRSILRRHALSTSTSCAGDALGTDSRPAHWPERRTARLSVTFLPGPLLITSVHERPYTEYADLRRLYYSSREIRQFKRDFRDLITRKQKMKDREEKAEVHQPRDNSFWRSKVAGHQWSLCLSSVAPCELSPKCVVEEGSDGSSGQREESQENGFDPLNDGSSVAPYDPTIASSAISGGGIFSSVLDVARDVANLMNTSASGNHCPASSTLVDTLYIF